MWIFPLGAAIVSAIFAALVAQQWLSKQRPHQLAWAFALLMFAVASFAAAIGVLGQWTPTWFRVYYLFGAIVNVPVLALGTVYLLGPRRLGHAAAALVAVATVYAAGAVFTAALRETGLAVAGIPSGREVMPEGVRTLSRYYSFAGFFVVVAGALWSAWRLARRPEEHLRRIAAANVLIAAGTFVVALASGFARYGQGSVFAVGLLAGVVLMFAGFLRSRPRPSPEAAGGEGEPAGG